MHPSTQNQKMETTRVEREAFINYPHLLYSPISHYYWRKKLVTINFQPSPPHPPSKLVEGVAQSVSEFPRLPAAQCWWQLSAYQLHPWHLLPTLSQHRLLVLWMNEPKSDQHWGWFPLGANLPYRWRGHRLRRIGVGRLSWERGWGREEGLGGWSGWWWGWREWYKVPWLIICEEYELIVMH